MKKVVPIRCVSCICVCVCARACVCERVCVCVSAATGKHMNSTIVTKLTLRSDAQHATWMTWCPRPYSPSICCAVALSAGTSSSTSDPGEPGNLSMSEMQVQLVLMHNECKLC